MNTDKLNLELPHNKMEQENSSHTQNLMLQISAWNVLEMWVDL